MSIHGLILILLLIILPVMESAAEFVLVAHKDNAVESLPHSEVRNIFLGKKTFWPNGLGITVLLQEDTDVHRDFTLAILGKSPRQFEMYWKRILFSGEGVPPRRLPSSQAVVETVAANPRALGYIDPRHLNDKVKAVRIERE